MKKYDLKYLVLHCTATKMGVNITPEHIIAWHTSPVEKGGRGWSRVGYNKLFMLDGTIHEFYPENGDQFVDADEVAFGVWGVGTFNCHHWVYAGGLDAKGNPMDTRTHAQLLSMQEAIYDYVQLHPSIIIMGHNQYPIKSNKACPCFWAPQWLENIGINKSNIYYGDPYGYKKILCKR